MVEDPQEIILEHLRYLRGEIDYIKKTVKGHDKRFDLVERQLAAIRSDSATMQELYVDHRDDFRSLADRVERIERRLALTESPQ